MINKMDPLRQTQLARHAQRRAREAYSNARYVRDIGDNAGACAWQETAARESRKARNRVTKMLMQ